MVSGLLLKTRAAHVQSPSRQHEHYPCPVQEAGQPEMAEKLPGNVGWGIGLEFRESNHLLRTRNTAVCRAGMAFNVVVGAIYAAC